MFGKKQLNAELVAPFDNGLSDGEVSSIRYGCRYGFGLSHFSPRDLAVDLRSCYISFQLLDKLSVFSLALI